MGLPKKVFHAGLVQTNVRPRRTNKRNVRFVELSDYEFAQLDALAQRWGLATRGQVLGRIAREYLDWLASEGKLPKV